MEIRLIAKREDGAEDNSTVGDEGGGGDGGSGAGKLRHRYVLKPVDAKARLALSVDPSDR